MKILIFSYLDLLLEKRGVNEYMYLKSEIN